LEYEAREPVRPVAATVMTLVQLAGEYLEALSLSLPAATTTVVPRFTAPLIAVWVAEVQAPEPPRLMLMTLATLVLAGTPETLPPDAQVMASMMSES
jgi:hypothetical protein